MPTEQSASIEELRNSYDLETGLLEIYLKDVEFSESATDLRGVAVRADAEAGDGLLSVFGRDVSGENVDRSYEPEGHGRADRRLSLELSVGTGVVSVIHEE